MRHLVSGVTASQALIEAARDRGLTPYWSIMVISGTRSRLVLPV